MSPGNANIFSSGLNIKKASIADWRNIFLLSLRDVNLRSYSVRYIYISNMKYTDRIMRCVCRLNAQISKYFQQSVLKYIAIIYWVL